MAKPGEGGGVSWEEVQRSLEGLPLWGKTLAAGGVALAFYLPYSWYRSNARASPLKKDFKQGVVYLYQLPRTKNVPSLSGSCLKLETWLRMADIPYENAPTSLTTRGLDGAMPFIELNGKETSHSSLAIRTLRAEVKDCGLDEHLSDEQRATCHAVERLVELSLRQSHLLYRAENADKVINQIPPQVFGVFAPFFSLFAQRSYIGRCASVLSASGLGRFSRAQRIDLGSDDLRALSKILGSKHYFTGFKPATVDATVFAVLAQIAFAPYESDHKALLDGDCNNLLQFVDRMKGRYWPDWAEATTSYTMDGNWKRKPSTPPSLRGKQLPSPAAPRNGVEGNGRERETTPKRN